MVQETTRLCCPHDPHRATATGLCHADVWLAPHALVCPAAFLDTRGDRSHQWSATAPRRSGKVKTLFTFCQECVRNIKYCAFLWKGLRASYVKRSRAYHESGGAEDRVKSPRHPHVGKALWCSHAIAHGHAAAPLY